MRQVLVDQGSPPIGVHNYTLQDSILRLTPFEGQVQYFQADSAEV